MKYEIRMQSNLSVCYLSGLFPSFDPAEDPVPALHEEPAVQHPADQPEPLPVLQTQEMHRGRNE
jgi:hypothetical protein